MKSSFTKISEYIVLVKKYQNLIHQKNTLEE